MERLGEAKFSSTIRASRRRASNPFQSLAREEDEEHEQNYGGWHRKSEKNFGNA